MEDDLNFKVNKDNHNLLAPASPELGTAQPQLVHALSAIAHDLNSFQLRQAAQEVTLSVTNALNKVKGGDKSLDKGVRGR